MGEQIVAQFTSQSKILVRHFLYDINSTSRGDLLTVTYTKQNEQLNCEAASR